jgi:hypothetical protein
METEHELKIRGEFYARIASEQKTFETRKNDRDFQVGDILILREFDGQQYIDYSEPLRCRVIYISTFAQQEGYVILGIKLLSETKSD